MSIRSTAALGICAALSAAVLASAADMPAASDVWKIEIGKSVAAIPDSFAEFACGSDGGPPGQPLSGFKAYGECAPGPNGWHEVYFRYDDELEYWAKAMNYPLVIASSGTKVYDLPVIMSVLIDDAGIVRGLRLVSDPRDTSVPLADARFLFPFLKARFDGRDGGTWGCEELPLEERESPVNGEVLKEDCTMQAGGMAYSLSVRYLRRAGQAQIDPHTGRYTENQFSSHVRFEMHQV